MKRLMLAACTLLVVAASTGVALAVADDDGGDAPASTAPVAPVRSVDPQISENLALFRDGSAAAGAAAIPAEALAVFERIGRHVGANVALARTAQTADGPVHIVPGDGAVCFMGPGGMACGTSAFLSSEPQGYAVFGHSLADPRGTVRVSGIAPDDVTQIDAIGPDGQAVSVPISGNAYSALVPADATRLEFRTASHETVTAPLPDVPK